MLRGFILCIVLLIVLGIAGGWFMLQHMDISSLDRPGRIENYMAIHAKHVMVAHAAQQTLPAETANSAENIEDGHTTYGSSCAGCHGYDGRTPTKLGQSLYPEAPSLAATHVQNYSDAGTFRDYSRRNSIERHARIRQNPSERPVVESGALRSHVAKRTCTPLNSAWREFF